VQKLSVLSIFTFFSLSLSLSLSLSHSMTTWRFPHYAEIKVSCLQIQVFLFGLKEVRHKRSPFQLPVIIRLITIHENALIEALN